VRCEYCFTKLERSGACPKPECLVRARADAYSTSTRLTGRELLDSDDIALAAIIRDEVLATAQRARNDIETFFQFVMRRTDTKQPIQLAPHQRVALKFIMDHDRSVGMWPIGSSKTFCTAGLLLFQLGQDPTTRAAVISASQEQAQKTLQVLRDYIETSAELHLVFPELMRTQREGEPWTQTALTIQRPRGIRDPSVTAYGFGSESILGSRLDWVIIDDILNKENSATHEQRMKVRDWVDGASVLGRLIGSTKPKAILINTPWHPQDIACHTGLAREGPGWACLQMDVLGDIRIYDDSRRIRDAEELGISFVPWDSDLLRPATSDPTDRACRLVAHDPDPENRVNLWPEQYTDALIAEKRRDLAPHEFNQAFRCMPTADETARCKQAYIDRSLQNGRDLCIENFLYEYIGAYQIYIGVDLAFDPGEEHDDTAFFVFEARPQMNVIVDIDVGQWPATEILDKLLDKVKRYSRGAFPAVVRVENNGGQSFFRKFALQRQADLSIVPHTTEQRAKAHPQTGVEGLFVEMCNGAWAFPNKHHGERPRMMTKFIEDCINYQPSKHTADSLMACYFARAQKIAWQGLGGPDLDGNPSGSFSTGVMMR
jgi:hypothetical protein